MVVFKSINLYFFIFMFLIVDEGGFIKIIFFCLYSLVNFTFFERKLYFGWIVWK